LHGVSGNRAILNFCQFPYNGRMKTIKFFGYTGAAAGSVLLLIGLFADTAGIGSGRGLGHVQLLSIILGLSLFYLTFRRESISDRFGSLSIIVMNSIMILLVLELASTLTLRLFAEKIPPSTTREQVDRPHDTSLSGFDERLFVTWIYRPYVLYRVVPDVSTGLVSTDIDGFRITPGAEAGAAEHGFLVYCFGGSTIWGWGEADDQTIPAHLQFLLSEHLDCPVEIRNIGQPGWLSSQELIQLLLMLWEGERPDLVVFYDGGNDLGAAVTGWCGSHLRIQHVESMLSFRRSRETTGYNLLWEVLRSTNTIGLLTGLSGNPEESSLVQFPVMDRTAIPSVRIDSLSSVVLECAMSNYRIALSLGRGYGFDCLFLWQPLIVVSDKHLTEPEMLIWQDAMTDSSGTRQIRNTWLLASELSAEGVIPGFSDVSGALDDCSLQCFMDEGHLNGTGNRIIAESIFVRILRLNLSGMTVCEETLDD